jgi:hypothetical protein
LSITNNFQVKNGISVNGQQVVDSNANGTFGTLSTQGTSFAIYDLDDLSYKADGFTNTFPLTYNQIPVTVSSPFVIEVTINGLLQPAFDYKYDTFWLSNVLTASKGYCIDNVGNPKSNGYIKFADCPPPNSQILVRTKGGYPNSTNKTYPFKPLDIVMGY